MPQNGRKSGKNMGFDTRGSMPVTCPITCSKIKVGRLARPTFILEIDRILTRVEGGAANESERFAREG